MLARVGPSRFTPASARLAEITGRNRPTAAKIHNAELLQYSAFRKNGDSSQKNTVAVAMSISVPTRGSAYGRPWLRAWMPAAKKNAAVSDSTTGSNSPPNAFAPDLRAVLRYLRDHLVFGRATAWPST